MHYWQVYATPTSLQEALHTLEQAPTPTCLIAGGTDLLLELQQDRHPAVHTMIDITSIAELRQVEIRAGELFIGAAASLQTIATHPLMQRAAALAEACGLIGGPQVRSMATLGGNVAHALPAADGAIALLALGAQAEIVSTEGKRRAPLIELYRGPGQTALGRHEILTGFYLPLQDSGGSNFRRVMRPQGVALPIMNMAAWLCRKDEKIETVRIAVGPAGPVPFRAKATEAILRGQQLNPMIIEEAQRTLLSEAQFRTSPRRATADYRRHISQELLRQVLWEAWNRTLS